MSAALKEIHISQFIVTGTDCVFTANRAIRLYFKAQQKGKTQHQFKINGQIINVKDRTQSIKEI